MRRELTAAAAAAAAAVPVSVRLAARSLAAHRARRPGRPGRRRPGRAHGGDEGAQVRRAVHQALEPGLQGRRGPVAGSRALAIGARALPTRPGPRPARTRSPRAARPRC